jgi:hypothetical protein
VSSPSPGNADHLENDMQEKEAFPGDVDADEEGDDEGDDEEDVDDDRVHDDTDGNEDARALPDSPEELEREGDVSDDQRGGEMMMDVDEPQLDDDDGWVTEDSFMGELLEAKKEGAKRFFKVLSELQAKAEKSYGDLMEALDGSSMAD